MKNERRKAIFVRWRDVIAYGAIASLIWYVFAPAFEELSSLLVNRIASVPWWPKLAFLVVLVFGPFMLVDRRRMVGMLGLRYALSFPPLWLSMLFALAMAVTINFTWPRDPALGNTTLIIIDATSDLVAVSVAFLAAVGIASLAILVIERCCYAYLDAVPFEMTDAQEQRPDPKEQLRTLEELKHWAWSDREITRPCQDLFDHDSIAQRIVRRLNEGLAGVMPTMAVVGERGSGKSTIGRLVEHYLHSNRRMLFVKLSLWPFDSTNAAVRGILSELIRKLGTRVNTLSLAILPEQYAAAAERLGLWTTVLALFRQLPNPKEIVEQVDRIAVATGLRIVFWIEDLERFSRAATIDDESPKLSDEERLGPIRSLLWLLNECDGISVIVADASLRSRFDVDKIARFVERIPSLDLDQAGPVIEFCRSECLNGHPKEIIDPVQPGERDKFKPSDPLVRSMRYYLSGDAEPKPFDALIQIVKTPRSLKNVLRITLETWEQLPGEIDLDHVIAASALRTTYPEVFEFVDTNIVWFCRGFRPSGLHENDPMTHPAYLAFEELLRRPPFDSASDAIRSIVRFVFPALPKPRIVADTDRQYLARPQGLNIAEPVNYWNRYQSCAPVHNEHTDQYVLRQIQAWKQGEENEFVSFLVDRDGNDQAGAFLSQFVFSNLLDLLSQVVTQERHKDATEWTKYGSPPGGLTVWRMMNRYPEFDSSRTSLTLEELLQELVLTHLPYARFLFRFFCLTEGSTERSLTDANDTKRLAELIHKRLLDSFQPGDSIAFRSALLAADPFLLRYLLHDVKIGCGFGGDLPIEGWEPFAEMLLELAELDPKCGIPIVLSFVTSANDRMKDSWVDEAGMRRGPTRVREYQLDDATAKKYFDWDRLRSLLTGVPIPESIEQSIREMWQAAKDAASS